MNEDYLWSKKGGDPDIENLENLLSGFRFEPGNAPIFERVVNEEPSWFSFKRFAWILGFATPSFALALLGFWLFTASSTADIRVRNAEETNGSVETRTAIASDIPIAISSDKKESKNEVRNPKTVPANVKTVYRSRKRKADRAGSLVAMRLTKQEKYAYDRLMLALSIAGTKLKVVQDAVDGNTGKDLIRNTK